uniref:Uncharacterized protein n=1 Tax=Steinernema glaseri TaxID=37863 RepID=A0A1I7YPH7_9BILA
MAEAVASVLTLPTPQESSGVAGKHVSVTVTTEDGKIAPNDKENGKIKNDGRRKKPKRNLEPEGFEAWKQEEQEYYREVSAHLRNWKATCRQSRCIRTPISWWQMIRKSFKGHPMHALEMDAYKKAVASVSATKKLQNLDLDL